MKWGQIIVGALIGAVFGISSTFFLFQGRLSRLEGISEKGRSEKVYVTPNNAAQQKSGEKTSIPNKYFGRLEGVLSDRNGKAISDITIRISNEIEKKTDKNGKFVFEKVPEGDQIIIVYPPSGTGEITQNIRIERNRLNNTNIVYSPESSRLALLSITNPVDDGEIEVYKENSDYFAIINGRSDGLSQIFSPKKYDIWLLVRSIKDSRLWLQHPPAINNSSTNTWQARVKLGDRNNPPTDGDRWVIIAVAAAFDSDINKILNTPRMSLLPPHISSNVVSAKSLIGRR